MKKKDYMNKTLLKKEYALSCIENYLLVILSQKYECWQSVFSESFMRLTDVIDSLGSAGYSYFEGIPRLHTTAMEQGYVQLEYIEGEGIFDNNNTKYYAIMVKEEYMKERYNIKPWREDHFILLYNDPNGIKKYLNDLPPDSGILDMSQILKIYKNKAIIFNWNDCIAETRKNILKTNSDRIIDLLEKSPKKFNQDLLLTDISILRDSVGIEKVLVKRQRVYLRMFIPNYDNSEYYSFLCKMYAKLEYMRLKNVAEKKMLELIDEINFADTKYYNCMEKLLGENEYGF